MERIVDLLALHHDFSAALAHIRTFVMDGQFQNANLVLTWLREALQAHIRDEEAHLFPRYAQLQVPANATVTVLARDHQLIGRHLQVNLMDSDPVELADQLSVFSGLLDHHDDRDSRWFNPLLDQALTESERKTILDIFALSLRALPPFPSPVAEVSSPAGLPPEQPMARCRHHLAVGSLATDLLVALKLELPKARRLRDRAVVHLQGGDRLAAYDTARLLQLVNAAGQPSEVQS